MKHVWTRDGQEFRLIADLKADGKVIAPVLEEFSDEPTEPEEGPRITHEQLFDSAEEAEAAHKAALSSYEAQRSAAYDAMREAQNAYQDARRALERFQRENGETLAWLAAQSSILSTLKNVLEKQNRITHMVVLKDDSGWDAWSIVARPFDKRTSRYDRDGDTVLECRVLPNQTLAWKGLAGSAFYAKSVIPASSLEEATAVLQEHLQKVVTKAKPRDASVRMLRACQQYCPELVSRVEALMQEHADAVRRREIQGSIERLKTLLGRDVTLEDLAAYGDEPAPAPWEEGE